MNKKKLAITLKTLLDKSRLSESELARRTGICQPVIHRMASGETDNPKIETLRPIAKFFAITLDQLIGDEPLISKFPNSHVEQALAAVPLITLEEAISWPPKSEKASISQYVPTDITISPHAYAIKLKNSTMYPMFPDGTLLIIEPNIAYQHKDFVIAQIQNEQQATFKQLLVDGKEHYLKSVNNDYQPYQLTKKDKILGIMLQARIDFRNN